MPKKKPDRRNKMGKNPELALNDRPGSNKRTGRRYDGDVAEYEASPARKKRRVELTRISRQRKLINKKGYGTENAKDLSHTKDGRVVLEKASTNRARNRGKK